MRASLDGPVLTVTLDRPEARNAQTPATWRALAAVGEAVPRDVQVVVLRGAGASFSAGLDRAMLSPGGIPGEPSLADLVAAGEDRTVTAIAEYQRAFTWWHRVDAVTVAVVRGHAVGAGFQLALACDLRVLADDARLSLREVQLGLVPDLGGTKPLVELVGKARALEIAATGRWVDAAEAERIGLANAVVGTDALDDAVGDLVASLLAPPAGAVRAVTSLLRDAATRTADEQLAAERTAQAARLRDLAGLS
ncbi:Methylthioacryloyl-CoA hydratase [Luteimicrobium xylanilyticum]|uniref:Methylthioacryloyl-CoA hydratase n=1 Tax=Luteimicrobium xylanilyticum TaxID=1133546 RepID=A0A5P9QBC6_9MICO|nr:Methylthioacryloyl-CoA hydratase [Luteimicrobium xylanilyticum]